MLVRERILAPATLLYLAPIAHNTHNMMIVDYFERMFRYSDWANDRLVAAAQALNDEQLDRAMDIGLGSLRATLKHIH